MIYDALVELNLPHVKGVYADIDGDSSVDQVRAEFVDGSCEAEVVSMFPVATEIFTAPICHAPGLWGDVSFFAEVSTSENTPVAVRPLVVPRYKYFMLCLHSEVQDFEIYQTY